MKGLSMGKPLSAERASDGAAVARLSSEGLTPGAIAARLYPNKDKEAGRTLVRRILADNARPVPEAEPVDSPSPSAPLLPESNQYDEKAGTWEASRVSDVRIHTLGDLLAFFQVDTSVWDVETWTANKWEVGAKNAARELVVSPLFQVKARFRKKKQTIAVRAEIEAMREEARAFAPSYPPVSRDNPRWRECPHLLEIAIHDLHMGKLAWAEETGENYDLKIAQTLFMESVDHLLMRARSYNIERIVFPVGNDLLHVDTPANATTGGTLQDVDSRYHKIFRTTRQMLVAGIEWMREVAPVDVVIVPGNHDSLSAFSLGDSLECWFHKCDDVRVDNRARLRKVYSWEQCAILFTHGDKEKHDRLPGIFSAEFSEVWGKAMAREVHVGHLHQEILKPFPGCAVRFLPSLSAADAWHSAKGFVEQPRRSEALVWHPTLGVVSTHYYTVPSSIK